MTVNAQQIKRMIDEIEANGIDLSTVNFEMSIYPKLLEKEDGHTNIMPNSLIRTTAQMGGYKVGRRGVVIYLEN